MEPVTIVSARAEDRAWAAALMAGTDPWITLGRNLADCERRCNHPEYNLQIAWRGGERLGFMLLHPRGVAGSPYIASIAVTEQVRGQGVGAAMLAHAEGMWPESRHIFLCVSSFNARARQLYARLGYDTVGELKDYAIAGASEFLMHKTLVRQ